MKKTGLFTALVLLLLSCNVSVSTEEKLDSLGRKIETKAKEAWDSTKADARVLKEKVENKLDRISDSADRKKDSSERK